MVGNKREGERQERLERKREREREGEKGMEEKKNRGGEGMMAKDFLSLGERLGTT